MAENLQQFIDTLKAQLAAARDQLRQAQEKLEEKCQDLVHAEAHLESVILQRERERDKAIERAGAAEALLQEWMQTNIVLDNQPEHNRIIELKGLTHLALTPAEAQARQKEG